MNAKSDRLDEYVRRASQLDEGEIAALADATARQALFLEITRQPIGERRGLPRQPTRRRVRFAVAVAAAGVLAGALAVGASTGVLGRHSKPAASESTPVGEKTPTLERHGDPFGTGPNSSYSCVPRDRLPAPTFAFDGTVASIGTQPPADPATGPAVHVAVTFTVNRWFRGGSGDRVTIAMPPSGHASSSIVDEHPPGYAIGSRLLVSGTGDQPRVAWPCGFTLWYNRADAQAWERAGGYAPPVASPSVSTAPPSAGGIGATR